MSTDIGSPQIGKDLIAYLHENKLEIVVRTFSGSGKFGTDDTKIIIGVREKRETTTEEEYT